MGESLWLVSVTGMRERRREYVWLVSISIRKMSDGGEIRYLPFQPKTLVEQSPLAQED